MKFCTVTTPMVNGIVLSIELYTNSPTTRFQHSLTLHIYSTSHPPYPLFSFMFPLLSRLSPSPLLYTSPAFHLPILYSFPLSSINPSPSLPFPSPVLSLLFLCSSLPLPFPPLPFPPLPVHSPALPSPYPSIPMHCPSLPLPFPCRSQPLPCPAHPLLFPWPSPGLSLPFSCPFLALPLPFPSPAIPLPFPYLSPTPSSFLRSINLPPFPPLHFTILSTSLSHLPPLPTSSNPSLHLSLLIKSPPPASTTPVQYPCLSLCIISSGTVLLEPQLSPMDAGNKNLINNVSNCVFVQLHI